MRIKPSRPLLKSSHPLNQGLVAAWLFNEDGGTIVHDLFKQSNGGLTNISGTTWHVGQNGPALAFDGTATNGTYLACGAGPALTAFSIAAWVYPTSFADYRMIVVRADSSHRNYDLDIETTSGKLRLYFTASGTFHGFTGATALALNAWSFVTGTFDGATQRLYINGRLDAINAAAFTPDTSGLTLNIGALNGAGNFFAGSISEVRIWNRALMAQEIMALYSTSCQEFRPRSRSWFTSTPPPVTILPLHGRTISPARGRGVFAGPPLLIRGNTISMARGRAPLTLHLPITARSMSKATGRGVLTAVSDLAVSKLVAYAVTRQPPQANLVVSKLAAYAITRPPQGDLSISKLTSYAVVRPYQGKISTSKLVAYAVVFNLVPPPPVFPTLPVGFPVSMTPKFANVAGGLPIGRDMRASEQTLPVWEFEINFEVLRNQTQNNQLYEPMAGFTEFIRLSQLFIAGIGQFGQFLFDAWWDHSRTDQTIGIGDGVTGTYTMVRTWGSGALQFTEPVGAINIITNVKVNGIALNPATDYTISNNNQITFTTPPGNGDSITSTFSFYYLCHMTESQQDYNEFYKNWWTAKIKFESELQR